MKWRALTDSSLVALTFASLALLFSTWSLIRSEHPPKSAEEIEYQRRQTEALETIAAEARRVNRWQIDSKTYKR